MTSHIFCLSFYFLLLLQTRLSKETTTPKKRVECLGRTGTMFYVQRSRYSTQPTAWMFNSSDPWGNTFIQANTVGLASYHFISPTGEGENGAYISYEHERCSSWPSLDDGSPVPQRVPFVNHSYDARTRTFRGTIPWLEVYGTTWQGDTEWIYEIIFDTSFVCILRGSVTMANEITDYGETLNYCNAAIVEMIKSEVNRRNPPNQNGNIAGNETLELSNNGNEENVHWVQNVREIISQLKTRLRDEGAGIRTLNLVSSASNGAIHPDLNLIDYNVGPVVSAGRSGNFNDM